VLPPEDKARIERAWWLRARHDQLPPPDGAWLTWLMLGGRGAGKTRAGAEFVRGLAMGKRPYAEEATGPIALVGETYADVREVMIEGASGLLTVHREQRPVWTPSRRRLVWEKTGVVAQAFSSEDPEALRGPQFAAAWADGVGHTAAAGPPTPVAGMTITREEAYAILARDLPRYERRVEAAMGALPQAAFDGAVSFDFNTGAIHRASWVKAYRAGNSTAARQSLMQWTKAGGRTVAGLVRRREAEARLIFDGAYGPAAGETGPAATGIVAYQKQLAALGFYRGAIDGIAGPATRAAVIAYQRSHPDLVTDGIVGPATLASLARDLAAREGGLATVAGTVGTALVAAAAAPADALLWAAGAAAVALALGGAMLALGHGGEIRRILTSRKGD